MARKGRVQSEMGIYHILLRGVNVLFENDADFNEFTATLNKYSEDGIISIFAYALLKNRIHLIAYANGDIGKALKPICTSYARYFNRTYAGSGKLFYDRFKSEPINSDSELKSAVAFVNAVAIKTEDNYPYCSLSKEGKKLCAKSGKLTASEFSNTKVTQMYIEDYDCLSPEEIGSYITDICGIAPKDFSKLSKAELDDAIEKLTKKRWIARSKLYDILGIKKQQAPAPKSAPRPKPQPKPEPQPEPEPESKPQAKQELSFWLL